MGTQSTWGQSTTRKKRSRIDSPFFFFSPFFPISKLELKMNLIWTLGVFASLVVMLRAEESFGVSLAREADELKTGLAELDKQAQTVNLREADDDVTVHRRAAFFKKLKKFFKKSKTIFQKAIRGLDSILGKEKCPRKNDEELGLEFIVCFAAKVAELVTSFMGKEQKVLELNRLYLVDMNMN